MGVWNYCDDEVGASTECSRCGVETDDELSGRPLCEDCQVTPRVRVPDDDPGDRAFDLSDA